MNTYLAVLKSKMGLGTKTRVLALMVMVFALTALPSFAQTTEPTIDIDVAEIFTSVNEWIGIFLPIVSIGIGIAIALAVLSFVGNQILKSFKSGK